MSHTPRSRAPSRTATPSSSVSPSHPTMSQTLRSSPSLSSLHIQNQNKASSTLATSPPPVPPLPSHLALDSTSSSVMNFDMNEGILVQDVDSEADTTDVEATATPGHLPSSSTDEESRKNLRDQLRRTLSHKQSGSDVSTLRRRSRTKLRDASEIALDAASKYPPREYFVLTDAGKPVFVSRPGAEDSDSMTSAVGIMQALISVFLDDDDKLRCINAGSTRITFLLRSPLYYVCASSWGEPESVTRSHLEYLHLQILSVVTTSQLMRIFERRTNFDLKRLLNGAEGFLTSLLDRLEFDLSMSTASLHCLRLDPALRKRAADALIPAQKMKEILYVLLVAKGQVITLLRPRKHSIHPADIHILLNTVHSPSILSSPAPSSWIPICLPRFNSSGFVNAYISFLHRDEDEVTSPRTTEEAESPKTIKSRPLPLPEGNPDFALVCISGGGDFDTIRAWCDSVTQKLRDDGTLEVILQEIRSGECTYSVSELGIPGLRHFVYKSRAQVQITQPIYEDPYDSQQERRRLITLYQIIHDAIHAKSGQVNTLKLQYLRTEKECVMGWITQPFELWVTLSPRLPKSAAVKAANAVARWVKKEEVRLFLRDAPVF